MREEGNESPYSSEGVRVAQEKNEEERGLLAPRNRMRNGVQSNRHEGKVKETTATSFAYRLLMMDRGCGG